MTKEEDTSLRGPMIEIPPLHVDGKLYYDSMLNMAYSQIPNPCSYCHAADLLELPNEDILCCWFAGSKGEGYSDVNVWLSRLDSGSGQWSEPVQISDDPERSEQNPSLFLAPDGQIWLVYTSFQSKVKELEEHTNLQYTSRIVCKKSLDQGRTWSSAEILFDEPGAFCRQKIQVLKNGSWIFGNWLCFDDDTRNGSDITVLRISNDQGRTWIRKEVPNSRGCVHLNVVERENGHLIGFFRSRGADRIYWAHSYDYGLTWSSPEPTELPNNNASISAISLKSKRIAIAYDACSFSEGKEKSCWPRQRAPLCMAVSDNEGQSFDYRRIVDTGDGFCGRKNGSENRRCEYPIIIESLDGKYIYLAYTWGKRRAIRFIRISEEWVMGKEEKDEGLKYIY